MHFKMESDFSKMLSSFEMVGFIFLQNKVNSNNWQDLEVIRFLQLLRAGRNDSLDLFLMRITTLILLLAGAFWLLDKFQSELFW